MQFFYKMFLGFIVIMIIVFGGLFVLRAMDNGWVDEEYPVLTESMEEEVKSGAQPWLFNREEVVKKYLSEKFPQKEGKILREKDLDHQFLYAVDVEGMVLKIRLQKRKIENLELPIWVIVQIQQDI